jgi:hypothetical protein
MPSNEVQFYCGMQSSLHAVNVPKDRVPASPGLRWENRAPRESDWSALPLQGAPAEASSRTVVAALAVVAGGITAVLGLKKLFRK